MKKTLISMMCVMLALVTTSCLQMHSTISINKDGSGTITEKVTFGAQLLAMMGGFGGEEAGDPIESMVAETKQEAEGKAKSLGEGVTFKEVKAEQEGGKKSVVIVYDFKDINKLRYAPGGTMNDGVGAPEGDEDGQKEEPMKFSYKDGVLTLDNSEQAPKEEAKPAADQEEEMDAAGMAMAQQMLRDMRVTMVIEIPGGIDETNASYVDGSTVTLMDMDMGALVKDEKKFKKLVQNQSATFAETKELIKGVEGCKIEPSEKLTIKLK